MESQDLVETRTEAGLDMAKTLGLLPMFLLIAVVVLRISWVLYRSTMGQKTRSSQQRQRMYVGTRTRQSSVQEPPIYVNPANLPPPKYEVMAPPSYEEVMGVHYPYQQNQPITQPITHALAQASAPANVTSTVVDETSPLPQTSVTENRQTSVTARS